MASNGDGRENAIVELPECREYLELQRRVFANAYFSKQKVKKVSDVTNPIPTGIFLKDAPLSINCEQR